MASSSLLLTVLLLAAAGVLASAYARPPSLSFYMHDMVDVTHKNSTTIIVASPSGLTTPGFGTVLVIDDPLTVSPSASSQLIGRARGTYMLDAMGAVPSLFLTFTAVLKDGTICFLGQDEITKTVREIAVVGGTGAYRFVTGYAEIRTQELILPFSAVLKVNVFLQHH